MTVFLRNGPEYHYRFMLASRRYSGNTHEVKKKAAQEFEAILKGELRSRKVTPAMVSGKVPLLSSMAQTFIAFAREAHNAGRYTDNGLKHYERGVKLLQRYCGGVWAMRLDRIRSEDLEVVQFKGPASANNAIRVLRRILGFAESRGLIAKVPRFRLREENERKAIISPDLEALILKHAHQPLHDAVIFGIDAAMRAAEICSMRWEDVKWQDNRIEIPRSKTKKGQRSVGMTFPMRCALQCRLEKANGAEWVFPSRSPKSKRKAAGGHLLPSSLDKMWREMKARVIAEGKVAWPDGLVFHSCRHTGATRYSDAVGNEFKVADFVGHADTRTTRRYVHHDEDTGGIMDQHRRKLEIVRKQA